MKNQSKISLIAAILAICSANPVMASNLSASEDKTPLSPVVVVSEYTGTPEHSNVVPAIYKSSDNGQTWQRNEVKNAKGRIRSISCNKRNYCVAVGEVYNNSKTTLMAYNSNDGGTSWTPHNLGVFGGASGLESVTCDENQHCVAVGAATPVGRGGMQPIVFTSFNAGSSWTANYPESLGKWPSGAALRAISCNGKNGMNCVAVGNTYPDGKTTSFISYTSYDGGLTWSNQAIADSRGVESLLTSISCDGDGKHCVSVGHLSLNFVGQPANHNNQAAMYETHDSGSTWAQVNIPISSSANASLNSITCKGSHCIAVGSENGRPVTLINKDNKWSKVTPRILTAVYSIPVKGLDIYPHFTFLLIGADLNSVICDNKILNCVAIARARYSVPAIEDGLISYKYLTLPEVFVTSDGGNSWQSTWLSIIDDSGTLRAIENTATDIVNTDN